MVDLDAPNDREGQEPQADTWQSFTYLSESQHLELQDRHRSLALESATHPTLRSQQFSLAIASVGDRVRILSLHCGEVNNRLMAMGLMPGVVLQVVSCTTTGSVIVALQDQRLGLGAEMAQHIQVVGADIPFEIDPIQTLVKEISPMKSGSPLPTLKLRDAAIGSTLRVMGYEPTARDYKRKLLAMGLTPGTELLVKRHAPLGDPTEIEVRGFHLSLRKDEADALRVEPI
jgi:ferrous iron transport protein A